MTDYRRSSAASILIVVVLIIIAAHLIPDLVPWFDTKQHWPLTTVVVGAALLVAGVIAWRLLILPGLLTLATGLILWYQNETNDWSSWAYLWALYPMVVGVGFMMLGALKGRLMAGFQRAGIPFVLGALAFMIVKGLTRGLTLPVDAWALFVLALGVFAIYKSRTSRADS